MPPLTHFGDAHSIQRIARDWIHYQRLFCADDPEADAYFESGYERLDKLVRTSPFLAFEAIKLILHLLADEADNESICGVLAAGPLEDLLAWHGETMIDAVEAEARRNEAFRALLRDVWRNSMTSDVWARVQALAGEEQEKR